VREEIRDLQRKLALTSIYVTHDQEEALAVSDKIIVMNNAVIAQEGNPHQLYEEPIDTFVADFIGDSNLITGEIVSLNGETAEVMIDGIKLSLPSRGMAKGSVNVAIRPEACRLSNDADAQGTEGNVLKAVYLGTHIEYTVDTAVGELFIVDHTVDNPFQPGTSVRVTLTKRGVALVKLSDVAAANV